MARKFLTSIDLNSNELIKAVVQNATSDPGTGKAGQLYYNTADDVLKVYSGSASAWVSVGSSEFIGDAVADLLDAGDGIYLNYNDASDSLISLIFTSRFRPAGSGMLAAVVPSAKVAD